MKHFYEHFYEHLLTKIPKEKHREWFHHIDLKNTCYKLEDAVLEEVILTGMGSDNPDEISMNAIIHYFIGNSLRLNSFRFKMKGVRCMLDALFNLPFQSVVCKECGQIRIDKTEKCENCLFVKDFSDIKLKHSVCTICQDSAFRTMLPCGHCFHLTCLLQMDRQNMKCPNCRQPFPPRIAFDLYGQSDDDDQSSHLDNDDEFIYDNDDS